MCPENPGTQQVDSMSKGRAEAAADKNQKIVHRLSPSLKASRPASIDLRIVSCRKSFEAQGDHPIGA
jgi:hypothetical protein